MKVNRPIKCIKSPVRERQQPINQQKMQVKENSKERRQQKRFQRHKDSSNHSKSSSNCSDSNSISKFYVKNIPKTIETQFSKAKIFESNKAGTCQTVQIDQSNYDSYGMKGVLEGRERSRFNTCINTTNDQTKNSHATNFLRRQLSPPQVASPLNHKKRCPTNKFQQTENNYNFPSPKTSKNLICKDVGLTDKTLSPSASSPMLTNHNPLKNSPSSNASQKNNHLQLELEKAITDQKKLHLLNEQLTLKIGKLNDRVSHLQGEVSRYYNQNKTLKEECHKMKILVKQRDNLMSTFVRKEQEESKNSKGAGELLMSKIIQFESQNNQLKETIQTLKKQLNEKHFYQTESMVESRVQEQNNLNQNLGHFECNRSLLALHTSDYTTTGQSELTWDENQFQDVIEQRDKEIIDLKEQIKKLQIEINYINRKWTKEVERTKNIEKLQYLKLKDKYKGLLMKHKDSLKMNFAFPPPQRRNKFLKAVRKGQGNSENQEEEKNQLVGLSIKNSVKQQQNGIKQKSPMTPRKRNYTVDHLKSRGVMSEIKPNYMFGSSSPKMVSHFYEDVLTDLQLEYSSCDEQRVLP